MTITAEITPGQLVDLVKEVQAGNEVVLTQGSKPVAKLIPTSGQADRPRSGVPIPSFKGHQVLTPSISQADLAEDFFGQR